MACFLVSGGEAIVVTAIRAKVKKKEEQEGIVDAKGNQLTDPSQHGICWTRKLSWLMNMLWGAVLMWLVDGMYRLLDGEPFIEIADTAVMFDDAMLGLLVAIIGLAAWTVYLVIKDPKHVLRRTTTHVS